MNPDMLNTLVVILSCLGAMVAVAWIRPVR
jgi:hypothetical protein